MQLPHTFLSSSSSMAPPFLLLLLLAAVEFSISAPLLLPLSHSLSPAHFNSTPHLLKSSTTRSASRFRHFRRRVSLPLSAGADYTLSFSIGRQTISLYMDTGSDTVWVPCHPFDCILCDGKFSPSAVPHPAPLNLSAAAAAVHCKSPACSAAHSSLPSSDLCAAAKCPLEDIEISDCKKFSCPPFYYAYGDGSFVGKLYEETLSFPASPAPLKLPKFTFACAHTALGEPIGVAGFGRGVLSFPAQLARSSPEIGNYFSYCLISHSFDATRVLKPSPLILGRREEKKSENEVREGDEVYYSYTPLLKNPKHRYFYCVSLEAMTVGNRKLPAPASLRRVNRRGDGGMVVDSGTTFTMLPREFYLTVVEEFDRRVGAGRRRAAAVEGRTGLTPCYYGKDFNGIPKMTLHFGGNSTVEMPKENYFYEFFDKDVGRKVGCLMVMDGGDAAERGGGPAGLLGNYQQQGFEVVYDLEEKRVGFARRKCASLWDALD